jgi:hypothetical protein
MSSGYYRLGGNVPGKHWAYAPGQESEAPAPLGFYEFKRDPPGTSVDITMPAPEVMQASIDASIFTPGPVRMERKQAIMSGFTGDQCSNCNSMAMKISGHCQVCSDCGTTTGCS